MPQEKGKGAASAAALHAAGWGGLILYLGIGLSLRPPLLNWDDTSNFSHWVSANFAYASSPADLSAMSPFQGMGGLIQPIAVRLNPAYILPHLLSDTHPRLWSILIVALLLAFATFVLGRARGLSPPTAIIAAQIVGVFAFPPMYDLSSGVTRLNLAHLYTPLQGFAVPAALGTLMLAVFDYLGRLSTRGNLLCILALPCLLLYSITCDPLYTAVFFVPCGVFMAGVFIGSGSKVVALWRGAGAAACILVCLALQIHRFYRALIGYAARAVFPNELYVEIQQWDHYLNLYFQGGLATCGVVLLFTLCLISMVRGGTQDRAFAGAVAVFILGTLAMSFIYLYSGIRWSQPLPAYLEMGALSAYFVAGFCGLKLCLAYVTLRRGRPWAWSPETHPRSVLASTVLVPAFGILCAALSGASEPRPPQPERLGKTAAPTGLLRYLHDELGIREDGRFRGSVVTVAGVPGGDHMMRLGVLEADPCTKVIHGIAQEFLQSFDRNLCRTGLWNLRIPTLEDNNHLVTPPYHFLFSRALSRPQDYHSRNWTSVTRVRPDLMAALGARFLISDTPRREPRLLLRGEQTNKDGEKLYVYEIERPNLGDLSPVETVYCASAREAVRRMISGDFPFGTTALVHDELPGGLVPAETSELCWEKGGVRLRARTKGRSLIVLPLQFSNSLRRVDPGAAGGGTPIRLIRVNLLQTGVVFQGDIDVKLAHVFGPFRQAEGRLRDIEDCRRLGIKETGEIPYPPNYQPHALGSSEP